VFDFVFDCLLALLAEGVQPGLGLMFSLVGGEEPTRHTMRGSTGKRTMKWGWVFSEVEGVFVVWDGRFLLPELDQLLNITGI
jgi:hypothetical protein